MWEKKDENKHSPSGSSFAHAYSPHSFAGRKLSNADEKKASPFDVKLKKPEKPEEKRKESLTDLLVSFICLISISLQHFCIDLFRS